MTLLDTPGHMDFSAEMERTLQVLDYGILVISGPDGVQDKSKRCGSCSNDIRFQLSSLSTKWISLVQT